MRASKQAIGFTDLFATVLGVLNTHLLNGGSFRSVLRIAEGHSVRLAAAVIGMSESTLSAPLRNLEEVLTASLFGTLVL